MQTITNITQFLLSLLSLALIAWLGWQVFSFLSGEQQSLAADTQSLLIIKAVIILVAAYMIARAIRNAAVTNSQGRRKAMLYENYIKDWLEKRGQQYMEHEEIDRVSITLLSSPKVINRMKHLETIVGKEGHDSPATVNAFKALVIAMRSDLGLNSFFNTRKEIEQLLTKQETYAE